jgi:transcriptional regulator with XRE-family HTH domain
MQAMKIIAEKDLPEYLRKRRGDKTQAEFGAFLGVSKQSVMQYEKGLSRPTAEAMKKLGIERCYRVEK